MGAYLHIISEPQAELVRTWLRTRGGIAVWHSDNLSDPNGSWVTPARLEDGTFPNKPHWSANPKPDIIQHPANIGVVSLVEHQRFHVAVRTGGNHLSLKLTDASTRKVKEAVAKAAKKSKYPEYVTCAFDYDTQEAVISVCQRLVSLEDYSVE